MIGKLLGHKDPGTTQRYAHLARDAVQAVNDEIGAVMQAAIRNPRGKIVKIARGAVMFKDVGGTGEGG
jgi:hypothetical protein